MAYKNRVGNMKRMCKFLHHVGVLIYAPYRRRFGAFAMSGQVEIVDVHARFEYARYAAYRGQLAVPAVHQNDRTSRGIPRLIVVQLLARKVYFLFHIM